MNFDDFVNSLSDEQKQKLMQGLTEASEKEPVKVNARDLPSEKSQLEDQEQEEAVSSTPKSNVTEDFRVVKNEEELSRGRQAVRAKKNQWSDKGEGRDPEFDPAVYEAMGKAVRREKSANKANVDCSVCGRSFKIRADLKMGEYVRCNRCTGR
jgi:hypothetical protein